MDAFGEMEGKEWKSSRNESHQTHLQASFPMLCHRHIMMGRQRALRDYGCLVNSNGLCWDRQSKHYSQIIDSILSAVAITDERIILLPNNSSGHKSWAAYSRHRCRSININKIKLLSMKMKINPENLITRWMSNFSPFDHFGMDAADGATGFGHCNSVYDSNKIFKINKYPIICSSSMRRA